jgi:hypothetical protein
MSVCASRCTCATPDLPDWLRIYLEGAGFAPSHDSSYWSPRDNASPLHFSPPPHHCHHQALSHSIKTNLFGDTAGNLSTKHPPAAFTQNRATDVTFQVCGPLLLAMIT